MSGNHGNTPAAWAGSGLAMVGFVIGGVALMVSPVNMVLFWVGLVLAAVALPLYLVMNKMGMGEAQH